MGEVELHSATGELIIRSVFHFYGDAASPALATQIAAGIQEHWNAPQAAITIRKTRYEVQFVITGNYESNLNPGKVWYNDNPQLNFFRIENDVIGNISFVDGIGSNTGYFKLDNLLQTSSTAAHEYGHTLGLVHPKTTDIRGGLHPGIMFPRGTLCDPELQYDPHAQAAAPGGVLDPSHRSVGLEDIQLLNLHKLDFNDHGFARLGEFTSIYHEKHEAGFG